MAAQPRRIIVGFDGTEGARRALESAIELMGYGSALTVVAVADEGGNGGRDVLATAREFLLGRLVTATYIQRIGEAAEELVGAADELNADLVIVGRRGGQDGPRREPGSVSADVVRSCTRVSKSRTPACVGVSAKITFSMSVLSQPRPHHYRQIKLRKCRKYFCGASFQEADNAD
jgi:nucleotide-binding universal stress UspA family protein